MSFFTAIRQNKPSFNPADTNALVGAVAFGKGLSKCRPPGPVAPGHPGQGPMIGGGPTLQQVTIGGGSGQQSGMGGSVAPQQQGQPGKKEQLLDDKMQSNMPLKRKYAFPVKEGHIILQRIKPKLGVLRP